MEEENFTEEVIQDVEACFRDFFLGCFNPCHSFDDEPEIVDGRLFGQNFEKIQAESIRRGELFVDPKFPTDSSLVAGHEVQWLRPHQVAEDPRLVVDGVDQVKSKLMGIMSLH